MNIHSSYSAKIKNIHGSLADTVEMYREAVDFFIDVILKEWSVFKDLTGSYCIKPMEELTHPTRNRPVVRYDFSADFYKFPSYYRRAAIMEAFGKVSSYKSNYDKWLNSKAGDEPGLPKSGYIYPAMYRKNCFIMTGTYTARIKVFIRNTWDWIDVELRKSDVDYIQRHCKDRKECVPTLQKRGKNWYLDFSFEEKVTLSKTNIHEQRIVSVDLGINNACVCSVMTSDGTVIGRKFLSLPKEKDSLKSAVNRIKKAQQHGARKMPRLWARAKGINEHIAQKTARFMIDVAVLYSAHVIIFEHLDLNGKKKGSKKQKLHMWRARSIQRIVTDKAHRLDIRVSHVNAWGTSKLAFDGSGFVERDESNYSMCTFATGKRYHCDLSATYNIGARYFIREILKSLPERVRLDIEAKVPQCSKRSTCTLSTLISLNAELAA